MKKCEYCFQPLEADMRFCPNCGAPVPNEPAVFTAPAAQPSAPGAATQKTNGLAIAALILGILSVFCCCFSPIFSILAIVLGAVALPKIQREKSAGKELAVVAIVLGGVMLLLSLVGGIITAITGEITFDLDLPDAYEEPYDNYDRYDDPFEGFFDPFEAFDGFDIPTPDTVVPGVSEI